MNNIANPNTNGLYYAGNGTVTPFLEELREAYIYAGLTPGNALDAAIADYADLLRSAA